MYFLLVSVWSCQLVWSLSLEPNDGVGERRSYGEILGVIGAMGVVGVAGVAFLLGCIIWFPSSAASLFFEDLSAIGAESSKTRVDAVAFDEAVSVVTTTMFKSWTTGEPTVFELESLRSLEREQVDSQSGEDMVMRKGRIRCVVSQDLRTKNTTLLDIIKVQKIENQCK